MQKFLTRPQGNTQQELSDKADILELINFERYCRDNALWDEMRKCFAPDSVVRNCDGASGKAVGVACGGRIRH